MRNASFVSWKLQNEWMKIWWGVFSPIQALPLIIQMFDFLRQYAVRINALLGWNGNFSFQKRKNPQILKQKYHRGILLGELLSSWFPWLVTVTGFALKFQDIGIFCSQPLINKVHSGNADRLWSKQYPQVLLWYIACLLKQSSSNSLAVFNWDIQYFQLTQLNTKEGFY